MPKVSIVVPVFNGSKYIERNSRYILEQEHKDIEVIYVVDSRTTDGSLRMIESIAGAYPSASIAEQTAGGLGEARNIGIDMAAGELIWFLDVDDRPLPGCLSTLVAAQEEHGADVVVCNCIMSKDTDPVIKKKRTGVAVMDKYGAMTARGKNRIPVTAWSKIQRTDVIKNNGLRFIPDGYAEDVDFTYRLFAVSDVICFCEEPLYVYIQNPDSICGTKDNERGTAEIRNYMGLMEHMERNEPEYFTTFRRNAVITMMRSSARMDNDHFTKFAKDRNTVSMVAEELACGFSAEMVLFRMFPGLYRLLARTYMKLVFYREGKTFRGVMN